MPHSASGRDDLAALYTPKLVTALREGYRAGDLRADAVAGLTVAVVALPLAMGIAAASGASPSAGLLTAVVAGFIISALGGSRHQIGGPTAAFAVVVGDVIARHGYDGLVIATAVAGLMLVAAGALRAGLWMKYVPEPVVVGFTAGIAVTIASTQAGALLGVEAAGGAHGAPLARAVDLVAAWRTADWATAGVGLGALALIIVLRRVAPRAPGFLIAMALATAFTAVFSPPVATIGSTFGPQTLGVHPPALGGLSFERLSELMPSAFTIAFLAGVESLLSATIADGMTGRRHRSNCELVAQGAANLVCALLGGLPATGAVARTATNIRAGARTPVAGVIHAGVLLVFALALGPVLGAAPLAALAAILLVVAWNMAEPARVWRLLARAPWSDRAVLATTFALTVLVDLTVAVEVGVVLAAVLAMRRMAEAVEIVSGAELFARDAPDDDAGGEDFRARLPEGVEAFAIRGPFFYAVADRLRVALDRVARPTRVFILHLDTVSFIDATGAQTLLGLIRRVQEAGGLVVISGAPRPVLRTLLELGLREHGPARATATLDEALAAAREHLGAPP